MWTKIRERTSLINATKQTHGQPTDIVIADVKHFTQLFNLTGLIGTTNIF